MSGDKDRETTVSKAERSYVAITPQFFHLFPVRQQCYDLTMNNFTERARTMMSISQSENPREIPVAQATE